MIAAVYARKSTGTFILLVCAATGMACADRIDREKFSGVSRTGHELKLHLAATGCGGATEPCTRLVKAFQLEAAALQVRIGNAREQEAFSAYNEAAEAYAFFARLRSLEADAVVSGDSGEKLLLVGTNEASAKRFNIPLQRNGSTTWADTGEALRITGAYADQRFAEAERLVTGGAR